MRAHRALLTAVVAASVGVAAIASADKNDAKPSKPAPAASASAKGVSAYDQQMIDAQKSFQAGLAGNQVDDAVAGYRKAIALDPNRPEGHLFLGAALYQKGDLPGADEALGNAVNRARADKSYVSLLGKALFLQATVKESMVKPDEAKVAWKAYADFAKENPDADFPTGSGSAPPMLNKVYPASALERDTKIDAYAKLVTDYAKVKDLVLKRLKELGETPKVPAPAK